MSVELTAIVRYSLGLAFSPDAGSVLLILKNRPSFLAGRWNGVGGHVEPGETPAQAMAREFREETGLDWPEQAWVPVGERSGAGFHVSLFTARGDIAGARTTTDEAVAVWSRERLADLPLAPDMTAALDLALSHWENTSEPQPAPAPATNPSPSVQTPEGATQQLRGPAMTGRTALVAVYGALFVVLTACVGLGDENGALAWFATGCGLGLFLGAMAFLLCCGDSLRGSGNAFGNRVRKWAPHSQDGQPLSAPTGNTP